MKKTALILCSLIFLSFATVKAQKVWSLEECINYALENNLQVKRQELNVKYSKNKYNESFSSGQAFDQFSVPPRFQDQNTWYGDASLRSNVTLFGGFQIINSIIKAKYDFFKSQSDLEKSKNDIQLQLALAYLQVLFTKELVEVSKSKLEVTSLQAARTGKLLE